MKITVIAYTRRAGAVAKKLCAALPGAKGWIFERERIEGLQPFRDGSELVFDAFAHKDPLIFVCAAGIAVRLIAPYVRSKATDPPVLVIDEGGHFVISLLSGHMGGANGLARRCAALLGAQPVITTATDVQERFAVDIFALENHLIISDMRAAKNVSASVVNDRPVYIRCESGCVSMMEVPAGLRVGRPHEPEDWEIVISPFTREDRSRTLRLIPQQIVLGIGCRRGIDESSIEQAVTKVLAAASIDPRAIACAASIDLKKNETGLVRFARKMRIPFKTFSGEELMQVPGTFSGSAFVQEVTGADNVCERSAVCAACAMAKDGGGRLLIGKQKMDGVTVAAAAIPVTLMTGETKA